MKGIREYKILTYRPICKIPKKSLTFSLGVSFFRKSGVLEDEYIHDEYGLYHGDDENAIAHAAGVIKKLQKDKDNASLKSALITDIQNYITCLICGLGNRESAYQLIKAGLWADCDKELSKIIFDYYNKCENDIDRIVCYTKDQLLDFEQLYLKAADRALYQNYDIDTAILFYRLTGELWHYNDSGLHISDDKDELNTAIDPMSGFSVEDTLRWNAKVDPIQQIMLGYSEVNLDAFEFDEKEELQSQFDKCIRLLKAYDPNAIDLVNEFIDIVGYEFYSVDDKSRLGIIMISSIRRNCVIELLFLLSNEEAKVKERYQKETVQLLAELREKKYKALCELARKATDVKKAAPVLLNLIKTVYYIEKLISLLQVKPTDAKYAYYTSFNTFSLMLPDACVGERSDECGRLSVMNVAYMNDPNEGTVIRKRIYGDKAVFHERVERKELKAPFVFIKCFTSMIDYLPMWQMYGDSGEGVCLVVEWDKESDISLYHVCYLNKTQYGYSVRKEDNKNLDFKSIDNGLKQLRNIYRSLKVVDEKVVFDSLIDPISYLFKDNSYSYEQEMRIMYRFDKSSSMIKKTKQNPPKLFVVHKKPTQIKEIILGPKFKDVTNTIPYLKEQIEKMAEVAGVEAPKVTLSNIDIR